MQSACLPGSPPRCVPDSLPWLCSYLKDSCLSRGPHKITILGSTHWDGMRSEMRATMVQMISLFCADQKFCLRANTTNMVLNNSEIFKSHCQAPQAQNCLCANPFFPLCTPRLASCLGYKLLDCSPDISHVLGKTQLPSALSPLMQWMTQTPLSVKRKWVSLHFI